MDETLSKGRAAGHVELPCGSRVGLPVRYLDWTGMMAHFPAPLDAVRKLLPTRKLKPVQFTPGKAVMSFAALEYRRIADVAPYNEVAIMTPVRYRPALNIPALPLILPRLFGSLGFYVWRMPVTTKESYELGVEVWGYPKLVSEISFVDTEKGRRCRVCAEGKDVLTLEVEQTFAKLRRLEFRMYTVKGGELLGHLLEMQGLYRDSFLPGGATLSLGDHPIAEELRALRIGEKAIGRSFASAMSSFLHGPDQRLPL